MCNKLNLFSSEDYDNVDTPILYSGKFDEYGLKIMDGGTSTILIEHCPWCGQKLPESKRDQWFDEMERMGIDPWVDPVPEEYQSNRWYKS